jgi:DNA-binding transcriptional regulator YiaG
MAKANIASVLKEEIARIARKEIRQEVEPLRKANAQYRVRIAELKRHVEQLERELKRASRARPGAKEEALGSGSDTKHRFSPARLKTQRQKLGLSAELFGRLVGVSGLTIYNWESGKTRPNPDNLAAISSLRGLRKRALQARIESLPSQ